MCAASLVYAVRMSESYDTRCRVGACQIGAPIGAGEARIPALVRLHDERLVLFFDERPAPASGSDRLVRPASWMREGGPGGR